MAKILLVEDDEFNRDMLSRRLTRYGHEVKVAQDGLEGVESAQTWMPEIILMDMRLPNLDGWAATEQLKSLPQTRRIPIIALTAHALVDDRQKCLTAGCDDYEPKPVHLSRLLKKIEVLLANLEKWDTWEQITPTTEDIV